MERRGATRYPLQLAVRFSWKDMTGALHGSVGQSRDLNGRGIFVYSDLIPPIGSSVEMNVLLPHLAPTKRPAELHAEGRVVRVERGDSATHGTGFATMNHTVTLRDAEGHAIDANDSWNELGFGKWKQ